MTGKLNWPLEVPVLTARDIRRDKAFSGPDFEPPCCLLGWINKIFRDAETYHHVHQGFRAAVRDYDDRFGSLAAFNDSRRIAKSTLAALWNQMMQGYGYTELHDASEA